MVQGGSGLSEKAQTIARHNSSSFMTIISASHKFIFYHLHKCGGTSVEKSYEKVCNWDDLIVGSTENGEVIQQYYSKRFGIAKHSSVNDIIAAIGIERLNEYVGFSLVRDPWSVTESFYTWIAKIFSYHALIAGLTADDLKNAVSIGTDRFHFSKWGAAIAYSKSHNFDEFVRVCLQEKYLPRESMYSRLNVGKKGEPKHIYSIDDIENLWSALESHIGKKLQRVHTNKSANSSRYQWSRASYSEISDLFAEDIKYFKFNQKSVLFI